MAERLRRGSQDPVTKVAWVQIPLLPHRKREGGKERMVEGGRCEDTIYYFDK